jgi:GNAT superfamily N-acetyltransferase
MMNHPGIDPSILRAWLAARSLARGLPAPVADRGGFRVETGSAAEIRRWVFPRMEPGLRALAHAITEPRTVLKLCGEADELRSVLPDGWQLHAPSYVMQAQGVPDSRPLADGYRVEIFRTGAVVAVRIMSDTGALAASGHAAETADAFVYDRIETDAGHRRKGLGRAVMAALRSARQTTAGPDLLVATEDGRALYSTLGWKVISPYSTASRLASPP